MTGGMTVLAVKKTSASCASHYTLQGILTSTYHAFAFHGWLCMSWWARGRCRGDDGGGVAVVPLTCARQIPNTANSRREVSVQIKRSRSLQRMERRDVFHCYKADASRYRTRYAETTQSILNIRFASLLLARRQSSWCLRL
jgi:hypothetical protein